MYEAIKLRKSVRKYKLEAINKTELELIRKFEEDIVKIFPEIDYHIDIIDNVNKHFHMLNPFDIKAPYYMAFYSEVKEDYQINAGYIMEQLSLFIISRGLGSCFMAIPNGIKEFDEKGRKYVISMAFGKAEKSPYRETSKANRMTKNKVCIYKEEPDDDMEKLIDAAILAPSAFNGQPWRFVVYNNRVHIFEKVTRISRIVNWQDIDMGIALANMIVAAEELWIDVVIKTIDEVKEKPYKKNKYIVSLKKQG